MEKDFWQKRWEENEIGFHESEFNPQLLRNFEKLSLEKGSRVFVPLCGKTLDITWLLQSGYRVAGAEWSRLAVEQLFEGLKLEPKIKKTSDFEIFSAQDLDIYVGDIFALTQEALGPAHAVYDRAALVALPEEARKRYAAHLTKISAGARQLLLSFDYDQSGLEGPPFSVSGKEIKELYSGAYQVSLLESKDVPGGLKGVVAAKAEVWLLR
ncbi:MAG: thiopurine S-methyltransferase [Deltaproteobacteria bacterium]|nr:thiopurine S-methyltransferase [Deltaproteobacteria bacterium]